MVTSPHPSTQKRNMESGILFPEKQGIQDASVYYGLVLLSDIYDKIHF